MPFPDDLSDLLPIPVGTAITRRLEVYSHIVYVEIANRPVGYRLCIYDLHNETLRVRFALNGLASEGLVEEMWQEFLRKEKSIFTGE